MGYCLTRARSSDKIFLSQEKKFIEGELTMKTILNTDNAPKAIGPYSQGINTGNLMFLSGQLPIVPSEGKIVAQDIEGQTKQSLENVKSILESAGCTMDNVVKTTVYLKNIADFGKMNEVYKGFFSEGNYPARSAFQVAALPQDALVEIEVVALKD
jgi:2-iminobutanoate/2-iminopropanoate deaminase